MTRRMHTGRNVAAVTGAVAVLLLGLAGCGGASSGASGTGATGVAAAESAAASAAGDGDSGSGDAARFTDAEACAWLKKAMPKIEEAGDDVSAQLALTLGLSSFFEEHGGLENADGYAFDEATVRGCKAEHDVAVAKAGIKSIGNL